MDFVAKNNIQNKVKLFVNNQRKSCNYLTFKNLSYNNMISLRTTSLWFLTAFFVFLTIQNHSTSQIINSKGTQVLLKGVVNDYYTNLPVSCEIIFKTESGNKIKIKSNSNTGGYEQIFNSGEKLNISFNGFDIIKQEEVLTIKETKEMTEQIHNFKVKQVQAGKELEKYDFFDANTAKENGKLKEKMEELKLLLRFNRAITFDLVITSDDTFIGNQTDLHIDNIEETNNKGKKKSKKEIDAMNKKNEVQKAKIAQLQKENSDLINKSMALGEERKKVLSKYVETFKGMTDRINLVISDKLTTTLNSNEIILKVNKVEEK